jgi:hypothetical protein
MTGARSDALKWASEPDIINALSKHKHYPLESPGHPHSLSGERGVYPKRLTSTSMAKLSWCLFFASSPPTAAP